MVPSGYFFHQEMNKFFGMGGPHGVAGGEVSACEMKFRLASNSSKYSLRSPTLESLYTMWCWLGISLSSFHCSFLSGRMVFRQDRDSLCVLCSAKHREWSCPFKFEFTGGQGSLLVTHFCFFVSPVQLGQNIQMRSRLLLLPQCHFCYYFARDLGKASTAPQWKF